MTFSLIVIRKKTKHSLKTMLFVTIEQIIITREQIVELISLVLSNQMHLDCADHA